MTLRMYAQRKGIEVDAIKVHLTHDRIHWNDCESCTEQKKLIDQIKRVVTIEGNVTDAQRARMMEIADMCPVHRTMMNQKEIVTVASP